MYSINSGMTAITPTTIHETPVWMIVHQDTTIGMM
jgi:hypothetical protein